MTTLNTVSMSSSTTKQHNDSGKIRIEPNNNGHSNKMITTKHKPIAPNTSSNSIFSPSKSQIAIAAKPPSSMPLAAKLPQHSNGIPPSNKSLSKTSSKQLNAQPLKQQQQQAQQIPIIINGNFQSILAACSNNNGAQQLATAAIKQQHQQQQQQIQVNTQSNQNNQQNLNLNQLQQYFQMANGNGQNLLCAQQQLRPQGMIFQQNAQQQQQVNQTQASIPLLTTTSSATQQTTANKPNTTQPTKNNSKTKQTLPNQNIIPQTNSAAASQSAPTTMFTATQTADGQIIFQTIPASSAMNNLSSMSQSPLQTNTNNHDLNQMQQNQLLMNLLKGAQGNGNLQQQFILNAAQSSQQQQHQQQLNQLIQQNMMHQQHQQQQIFLNQLPIQSGLFSQPVASSTPTPILPQQQNSDSNIQLQNQLRQKLQQEEQKNQQLQQQLEQKSNKIKQEKQSPNKSVNQSPNNRPTVKQTNETLDLSMNKDKTSVKSPSNIKPKPLEMKPNKTDTTQDLNTSHKESSKLNKSSNSLNSKRRGRPRLYAVNPETGKAIKGCLINESSKSPKAIAPNMVLNQQNGIPVHLTTQNGMAIFPSPSTSSSSSYSPSVSTIFIPNLNNQRLIIENNQQINKIQQPESNDDIEELEPVEDEEEEENDSDESTNSDETMDEDNTKELRSSNKLEVSVIKKSFEIELKKPEPVLTHVIDGYLIKESSKPFPIQKISNENRSNHSTPMKRTKSSSSLKTPDLSTEFKCSECGSKTPGSNSKFTDRMCCSVTCFKRFNRKLQKMNKKSKCSSSHKENNKLEDSTLNASSLSVNNSINKSKSHRHKRRHRHHHGSSSSSSREKSLSLSSKKKKQRTDSTLNKQSDEQQMDISNCLPPPSLSSLTISGSPQLNSSPQFNNPFTSTLAFNLPNNSSSPNNSSIILNNICNNSDQNLPQGDPTEWNCDEVFQFIKCVAGIQVAQLFRSQEVDGSALSLIRDDHLVNTMQIKLGPALKIMSKFNELNSRFKQTA